MPSISSNVANVLVRFAAATVALLSHASAQHSFQSYKNDPNVKIPRSSIEKPGDIGRKAHTNFLLHTGLWKGTKAQAPSAAPDGYGPGQIKSAYGIANSGGAGVICIVDAYDYPTALNDFNEFSSKYGLPQESSTNVTANTNPTFQIVYGAGSQPASDPDWNMEEALDIEWSHAMAPDAKIVLVEAASDSFDDLYTAVSVATSYPGVREVSISWGGSEFAEEGEYDSFFAINGIIFFVAAGDVGGAQEYPAVSPYVIGCGGTSLYLNSSGARTSEIAWIDSGGGPSYYEPLPYYQDALTSILESRGCPDIASDADPNTGVAVYDSTSDNGYVGWVVLGGTSVAAPTLAGVNNLVNDGQPNTPDELAQIYSRLGTTAYYDITQGTAGGFVAVPGWDFITGVGTLNGTSLQLGSPWAQFHANSKNTALGIAAGAGAGLKWVFSTESAGVASPVIGVDGTIYVSAQDNGVYALNSSTGHPNWVAGFGTPTGTPAIGADGSLYLSSSSIGLDSDSVFSLFTPSEPILNWADYTGLCTAPPVIGSGIIYVASTVDGIFAIHAGTGGLLWNYNTGDLLYPPAIGSNGVVYIGDQLGFFYAFNGATGAVQWEQSIANLGGTSGGWTSPAIGADGTVYVGYALTNANKVASGGLAAFNGATGTLLWSLKTNSVYNSPAIGPGGDIYFSDSAGYLYGVTSLGAETWSHKLGSNTDAAVDSSGTVYAGSGRDLVVYNGVSGALNWTFSVPAGDLVQTAPAIGADGTIYFGSGLGNLYAVGANTLSTLSVSPTSVVGGSTANGHVQITGIAGVGGDIVSLKSSNSAVKVPSSVSSGRAGSRRRVHGFHVDRFNNPDGDADRYPRQLGCYHHIQPFGPQYLQFRSQSKLRDGRAELLSDRDHVRRFRFNGARCAHKLERSGSHRPAVRRDRNRESLGLVHRSDKGGFLRGRRHPNRETRRLDPDRDPHPYARDDIRSQPDFFIPPWRAERHGHDPSRKHRRSARGRCEAIVELIGSNRSHNHHRARKCNVGFADDSHQSGVRECGGDAEGHLRNLVSIGEPDTLARIAHRHCVQPRFRGRRPKRDGNDKPVQRGRAGRERGEAFVERQQYCIALNRNRPRIQDFADVHRSNHSGIRKRRGHRDSHLWDGFKNHNPNPKAPRYRPARTGSNYDSGRQ